MKYIPTVFALALAVTFASALPYPTEAPRVSWGPSEFNGNALVEKRGGGHDGHGPHGWGPPGGGPPGGGLPGGGPPGGGPHDWGHSQPQHHDNQQQQQQQQQQQSQDEKPYSYNSDSGLSPDEEEAEDNITLSHIQGGSKE